VAASHNEVALGLLRAGRLEHAQAQLLQALAATRAAHELKAQDSAEALRARISNNLGIVCNKLGQLQVPRTRPAPCKRGLL
jgi:hypothetical protein